jgi:hypothetical protein
LLDVSPLVGRQRDGRVCVAVFMPPNAGEQLAAWERDHHASYGPKDDWNISLGRAVGGDFVSVWVRRKYLPPDFPVGRPLGR